MLLRVLLEGVGLGVILMLVCAVGIRNGAVGMVHLYHADVQERCVALGLTTREKIRKNALRFKAVCLPIYIAYVLIFVYAVNGARGFLTGHTKAGTIPGTEQMKPYINAQDKSGSGSSAPSACWGSRRSSPGSWR